MSPRLEVSDRSSFERRHALIEHGATPAEIVAETFEFTKKAFSPYSLEHKPHAVEALRQEHLRNNPATTSRCSRPTKTAPRIGDRLHEIRCPTLIIVGEHDGRTPLPMAEDLNKAIPRSFVKIVPQCGHFYSYEQPAGVSETILTFLAAFAAGREPATAAYSTNCGPSTSTPCWPSRSTAPCPVELLRALRRPLQRVLGRRDLAHWNDHGCPGPAAAEELLREAAATAARS